MLEGYINGLAAVSIQKESIELKFKFNAFESNVSIQPEKIYLNCNASKRMLTMFSGHGQSI